MWLGLGIWYGLIRVRVKVTCGPAGTCGTKIHVLQPVHVVQLVHVVRIRVRVN